MCCGRDFGSSLPTAPAPAACPMLPSLVYRRSEPADPAAILRQKDKESRNQRGRNETERRRKEEQTPARANERKKCVPGPVH